MKPHINKIRFPLSPQWLLIFIVLLVSSNLAKAQGWIELDTQRFKVISQLNEKATLNWAVEFNQFIDSLSSFLLVDESKLADLTIVIFRRNNEYEDYLFRLSDGEIAENVSGYFTDTGAGSMIAFPYNSNRDETRNVIFHEAVHWYANALPYRLAPWINEGLAEVYSSATIRKGVITWGEIQEGRLLDLQYTGLMPVASLVKTSTTHNLFNDDKQSAKFYATAWLMVHYQIFGGGSGSNNSFGRYLALQQSGISRREFIEIFEMDYPEMDESLKTYMRRGRFNIYKKDVSPPDEEFAVNELNEIEMNVILAQLAIAVDRIDTAQQHLEVLSSLQAPSGVIKTLNASIQLSNDNPQDGIKAARTLIASGEAGSGLYFQLAKTLYERQAAAEYSAPDHRLADRQAREISDLLNSAINLTPEFENAYLLLARVVLSGSDPKPEDEENLLYAAANYLDTEEYLMALASLAWYRNEKERAFSILAQTRSLDINDLFIDQVDYLYTSWRLDSTIEDITKMGRRSPEEALKVAQDFLDDEMISEEGREWFEKSVYEQVRENLEVE